VSVASAGFSTNAVRDPGLGMVTKTTAVADGVEVAVPQAGELTIAKVVSEGTTQAHGRPGTTGASWSRVLEGVVVRDAKGKVVASHDRCVTDFQPGGHGATRPDDCATMERTINDTLGTRVRFDLPSPEVIATPKGAFAGIQQPDAAYLQGQTVYGQGTAFSDESLGQRAVPAVQIAVFNDNSGQSRLLLQLAAIQASSIYTISLPSEGGLPFLSPPSTSGVTGKLPATGGGPGPVTHGGGGMGPGGLGTGGSTPAPATTSGSTVGRVVGVLIRSPKDALLMAGVWVLFLVAAWSVARRRTLIDVLQRRGT
jgi:hypothetical protein